MKKARYALIGALCVTVGLVAGCSKSLDTNSVQDKLKAGLTEQLGGDYTVTCPDKIEVKAGATFDCSVVTASGTTGTVTVTQTDENGNLTWEITGSSETAPSDAASPASS